MFVWDYLEETVKYSSYFNVDYWVKKEHFEINNLLTLLWPFFVIFDDFEYPDDNPSKDQYYEIECYFEYNIYLFAGEKSEK